MLKKETGLPIRLIDLVLDDLCAVKILEQRLDSESSEPTYAPYEDIDNITVSKMLDKLNARGNVFDHHSILDKINPKTMKQIKHIWNIYHTDMNEVKIYDLWSQPDDKTSENSHPHKA